MNIALDRIMMLDVQISHYYSKVRVPAFINSQRACPLGASSQVRLAKSIFSYCSLSRINLRYELIQRLYARRLATSKKDFRVHSAHKKSYVDIVAKVVNA